MEVDPPVRRMTIPSVPWLCYKIRAIGLQEYQVSLLSASISAPPTNLDTTNNMDVLKAHVSDHLAINHSFGDC